MPNAAPRQPPPLSANPTDRERQLHAELTVMLETEARNAPQRDPLEMMRRQHAQLRENHYRFLATRNPLTASILMALMRPATSLISEFKTQHTSVDELPGEDDRILPPKPAIIAIGETIAAKALLGDSVAVNLIADRIEGRVGTRKGDENEDTSRLAEVQQMIEGVVRALTNNRNSETDSQNVEVTSPTLRAPRLEERLTHAPTNVPHIDHTNPPNGHANGSGSSDPDPLQALREEIEARTRRG